LILRTVVLATLIGVATAAAGPIQYTLTAPAITTGSVLADAFSLTFTSPTILSSTTNLITLGTLSVPTPFDANFPTLVNANLFPTGVGSLAISFNGPPGSGTEIGSMLGSVAFDHTGVYSVNWQIVANPTAGDSVTGTLTITDLASIPSPTPEPSTFAFATSGLALAALVRRRYR
jgi:hypothetical protein